ncbi:MAG: NAD(P)H-dependent glycerol-3-phosphate dehydrogenase [Fuerstiella sp.]
MTSAITILGGGAMGTACACVLADRSDLDVRLWVRNPVFASHMSETRENSRLLPGVRISPNVQITADAARALSDAEVVVLCVPTKGIRDALAGLAPHISRQALMVSAVKGIENDTLIRPSQMIQQLLGERSVVAFGGPCHAEEVARARPATVVAAADQLDDADYVQQIFSNHHLRVYSNDDLKGVEYAGALKNVIAIAAGIGDGLEYGDNAKSALITRGLTEMVRFGQHLGCNPETFYGLAGIGDLVATCGSQHSRNRRVGELLGRGYSLDQIENEMSAVAEGVLTARSIFAIAEQNQIDMPIATAVYEVLFQGKAPRTATLELMQRPLKREESVSDAPSSS